MTFAWGPALVVLYTLPALRVRPKISASADSRISSAAAISGEAPLGSPHRLPSTSTCGMRMALGSGNPYLSTRLLFAWAGGGHDKSKRSWVRANCA
eukprot:4092048-Prymnesium_polylepis.1